MQIFHNHSKLFHSILVFALLIVLCSCAGNGENAESSREDTAADEVDSFAEDKEFHGSCDVSAELGFCYDYTGNGWTYEMAELDCSISENSLLVEERCPQESRVAYCEFDLQGKPEMAIVYHFYQPMESSMAEMSCPGTFFPIEQ